MSVKKVALLSIVLTIKSSQDDKNYNTNKLINRIYSKNENPASSLFVFITRIVR